MLTCTMSFSPKEVTKSQDSRDLIQALKFIEDHQITSGSTRLRIPTLFTLQITLKSFI